MYITLSLKKVFAKIRIKKDFYSYVRSKLKLIPSLPPLYNDNNKPLISNFEKLSLFNKSFHSVFEKDQDHQDLKLVSKICGEILLDPNFFITYDGISKSINLKDKIIRTP